MTDAHLHLIVNHAPIFACYFALLFLLLSRFGKDVGFMRAVLVLSIIGGITAFLSDKTGGPALHAIRDLPEIVKSQVRDHTAAADWALWYAIATGALSCFALWQSIKKGSNSLPVVILLTILLLFTATTMTLTGYRGGLIRHPEISNSFQAPPTIAPKQVTSPVAPSQK